tara:strand:- start:206 stop:466 length:261 start_codon:yes stop_codon:yes gene_type:complete
MKEIVDLRPVICDAVISGRSLEVETKTAIKNIADALPTDGAKITPKMLDSKSDLEDLMKGSEMFKVVETVDPIKPVGFSFSHGYLP